jgi:hypothetical protein
MTRRRRRSKGVLPADMVEQPCGVFDGVNGHNMQLPSPITISDGDYIEAYYSFGELANSRALFGNNENINYLILWPGDESTDILGETDTNADNIIINHTASTFLINTPYLIRFGFTNNIPYIKIDGVTFNGNSVIDNSLVLGYIGQGVASNPLLGKCWDFKIVQSGVITHYYPDPSTGYDISGNGNHGTVTGLTQGDVYPNNDYFSQYGCTWVTYGSSFMAVPYDITKTPIYVHASPIFNANENYREYKHNYSGWR